MSPRTPFLMVIFLPLFLSCTSTTASETKSCSEMTRFECMESTVCTLTLSSTPDLYTCAPSEGCGEGVSQNDLQGEEAGHVDCTSLDGCVTTLGECYCGCRGYGTTLVEDGPEAEECDCACAGGEPQSCVSAVNP